MTIFSHFRNVAIALELNVSQQRFVTYKCNRVKNPIVNHKVDPVNCWNGDETTQVAPVHDPRFGTTENGGQIEDFLDIYSTVFLRGFLFL